MISLTLHYLIDAEATEEGVKLTFFNPSIDAWEEVLDRDYRAYFFVPYPLTQKDQEVLDGLIAKTSLEEKRDLFTDQTVKVTRVEIDASSDSRRVSKSFEKAWEGEVPLVLGYAYDQGLTFGAQHYIQGKRIKNLFEVSEKTKRRFEEEFSGVKDTDPAKYDMLERWFNLCSQPVPEVALEKLKKDGRVDPDQHFLAFMLSRVANLPLPMAYSSHQVSTWIRSILHNHLRRNNILIPTSKELRRNETKRRIQGALTFPPETGVHFNTVVVDFHSLYPSIIDAYNLSHETINCPHEECQNNKVPGFEHCVCRRRRGVYSILIGSLKDLRVRWYKPIANDKNVSSDERRQAKATSQLLKLILVSSYGVTVRIHGLARPSLAESITAYGRYSLQTAWDIAKEMGLHPIYGDTDSLFLDGPSEDQVKQLIRTVKERLHLDLAIDEQYSICVLPRAMKAYFGIKKDGTADVKGVTAIKSNSPTFIQNVFKDSVKEMAVVKNQTHYVEAKGHIRRVVRDAIKNLKDGKVRLEDLEYQVEVHEDPIEKRKEKVLHQPYQCAIQLIDSGKPVQKGTTVNFVKVKSFQYRGRIFTVKPTKHVRGFHEVNIDDYVRNLKTALNQTFKPMDIRFNELEERRVTLADFV